MSLHLAFNINGWASCQRYKKSDDVIVLIGDGVYVTTHETLSESTLVMRQDLDTRGLSTSFSDAEQANLIDYEALVKLTEQHTPVVSWHE